MPRNGNNGSATSAANVAHRIKRRSHAQRGDVRLEKLKRDVERGWEYFWSRRPDKERPEPLFRT